MEEFILSAIFLACLFGIIILFEEVVSGVLSDGYDYHRRRAFEEPDVRSARCFQCR